MRLLPDSSGAEIFLSAREVARPTAGGIPPGAVVAAGRYRTLRCLGEGATSAAYLARDLSRAMDVVLKVWTAAPLGDREVEALSRLSHPDIPELLDAGSFPYQGEPRSYLSASYRPGRTLAELEPLTLSPRRSIEIVLRVARAIEHAHSRGVLHRDLSLANVLVGPGGAPSLIDFGLAELLWPDGPLSRARAILGTPEFLAPEQARGEPSTVRTDVHGLGGLLLHLVLGRPPYPLPDHALYRRDLSIALAGAREAAWPRLEALLAARGAPLPPLATEPHLDREIESIVHRALANDPGARFPSAADFAEALENYLALRRRGAFRILFRDSRDPHGVRALPLDRARLVAGAGPEADIAVPGLGVPRAFEILDTGAGLFAVPFDLPLVAEGLPAQDPVLLEHGSAFDAAGARFHVRVDP